MGADEHILRREGGVAGRGGDQHQRRQGHPLVERAGGIAKQRLRLRVQGVGRQHGLGVAGAGDADQPLVDVGQALQPARHGGGEAQFALGARQFALAGYHLDRAAGGQPGFGREQAAQRYPVRAVLPQQAGGQLGVRPFAADIIVQIGIQGLVFRVQFRCQADQHQVALVVIERQCARQVRPWRGRGGLAQRADVDRRHWRGIGGLAGAHQFVHLAVADIQAAQFIERQFVARTQAPDLVQDQRIEPGQFRCEGGEGVGDHGALSGCKARMRPSGRTTLVRFSPAKVSSTSSGARPAWTVI